MKQQRQAALSQLVFRATNRQTGRTLAVTPDNSAMKHLRYGRVILNAETPRITFSTEKCESGLICLSGAGRVSVAGETYYLGRYDAIYLPPKADVEISSDTSVDFVECAAEVQGSYPVQMVRYADVEQDPALKFATGGENNQRTINILLGKNVEAGRILAGVTQSQPGHWTSWPPHEHAAMLEELYVYYDMPAPSFGVQFVYTDTVEPELAVMVREGDAVLMPQGFHPNVAIPGYPINFVWLMAAHRETEDRQFGVVTVQPGLDGGGSGLEASRK
jgi:5-deoxy-glucuronate isomerase